MANKKISELPYINSSKISGNTLVPLVTYFSATTGDTVHTYANDLKSFITSGLTNVTVTGGTYSAGTITFTNTTGGTFSVTGLTTGSTTTVSGNFLPLSGGTVTGPSIFTSGVTANTLSATTYLNLPVGFTGAYLPLSGGTVTGPSIFTSGVTANTISATTYQNLPTDIRVTGGTYSAGTIIFTNNTGGTFNVTGLTTGSTSTVSGNFLPLSGGTVTGRTFFTSGVTANTLNVTGLTQTKGITSTGGITFKQVTISSSYTATTDDYMIDVTGGTFTVSLPTAVGVQGRLIVVKNNGGGAVTVDPFGSETIDGKSFVILGETNSIQLASNGTEWVALGYNISTVNSSTGVFEFTGITTVSPTTFKVAPLKGWIVDDTTNPLSPQLYYITYSGGVHTAIYVTATTGTWIYLTSGGTITQSNIPLTDQQRRQNIFLGKLGHANKTSIINSFSNPDFVLSPLSQLRDMFEPINLINGGIRVSANGANLSINTSAGYLHGLGINFANDTLNPNAIYLSGTSPCTFQYRTQTGGTASNVTLIDPTKKDVGGVVTTISGTKATNQRIYLVQNGVFRVQYGQVEYSTLAQAVAGIATEQYVEFSNFSTNGILIGVLSVLSSATDLTDSSKALFFNVSKFGDSSGAAGGTPTTNLQQAYDNSITPEITTNSTLGALSVKNGAGTLDNVTNVFEGVNAAGTTTSYVRADGAIYANRLSGVTISATTYLNLPSFSGGSGNCITDLYVTNVYGCSPITLQSSLQNSQTISTGDLSHSEGFGSETAVNNAYSAQSVSSGLITLSSTYGDVTGEFSAGDLLLFYDIPFDNNYGSIITTISASTFNGVETEIQLQDITITATTAYVGDISFGINNWTGDQTIPGHYSHAEGYITFSMGQFSHSEGSRTYSIGENSHAEGYRSLSIGEGSHAEGSTTQSRGTYSHSEGTSTQSIGITSHSEGNNTKSIGESSHSEGRGTSSIGASSHSEGISTKSGYKGYLTTTPITSGVFEIDTSYGDLTSIFTTGSFIIFQDNSAEINAGVYTSYLYEVASSTYNGTPATEITLVDTSINTITPNTPVGIYNSHDPLLSDQSIGAYSHSEGIGTQAIGDFSHSEGEETVSLGWGQTVVGRFNDPISTPSAFIVGDGENDTKRHNLLVASNSGVTISGTLSATSLSGASNTITGTKGTITTNGSSSTSLLTFSGSGTVGGTGYTDFIRVTNTAVGATSPSKTFRTDIFGSFEIINNAYNSTLLSLTDAGNLTVPGRVKSSINYSQTGGGASVTLGASASPQTILSVSLTTYGNPVRISAYGDAENTGAGYWCKLQFWRDSTQLGAIVHTEGSAASENTPFGMSYIDNPTAGTYTYYLKANEISGGNIKFGESTAPTLNVQEL